MNWTQDQLKERAIKIAIENKVDIVHMTTDGQVFLPGKRNLAALHAKSIKGTVLDVEVPKKEAKKVEATPTTQATPVRKPVAKKTTTHKPAEKTTETKS